MLNDFKDSPFNIQVSQFLFYICCLFIVPFEYFLKFSLLPSELYLPQGLFSFFSEPLVLKPLTIKVLNILWIFSGVFSAVNFYYKINSFIFFIITFLGLSLFYNYGFQTHAYIPVTLVSFVMCFGKNNRIFLVRVVFVSLFFMAGMSKLRNSGLDWIFTENLQNWLINSTLFFRDNLNDVQRMGLNYYIAKNLLLCQILALGVVLLEVSAPLALISKKARTIIPTLLFLMQVTVFFTIFVNFKPYLLMYLFWVNWEAIDKLINRYFLAAVKK